MPKQKWKSSDDDDGMEKGKKSALGQRLAFGVLVFWRVAIRRVKNGIRVDRLVVSVVLQEPCELGDETRRETEKERRPTPAAQQDRARQGTPTGTGAG